VYPRYSGSDCWSQWDGVGMQGGSGNYLKRLEANQRAVSLGLGVEYLLG